MSSASPGVAAHFFSDSLMLPCPFLASVLVAVAGLETHLRARGLLSSHLQLPFPTSLIRS